MPLTALLRCSDLDLTREYYRDTLGFEVTETAEGTIGLRLQDCNLVFTTQDVWAVPTQCSATFYLHVDDVGQYFDRVKDKAQVAWPLQDMPYGSREFGVRDCNGYYLAFAQVVDQIRSSNLEAKKVPM